MTTIATAASRARRHDATASRPYRATIRPIATCATGTATGWSANRSQTLTGLERSPARFAHEPVGSECRRLTRDGSTPLAPAQIPQRVIDRVLRRRGRLHAYESLDAARTALLVVDLQVHFMREGSPSEIPHARAIVPTVNRLAGALRAAGGTSSGWSPPTARRRTGNGPTSTPSWVKRRRRSFPKLALFRLLNAGLPYFADRSTTYWGSSEMMPLYV